MNRKNSKIQIIPPFQQVSNNWELVTEIESSLNQYLTHPVINYKISETEDVTTLGKTSIEQLVATAKQLLQYIQILRTEHKFIESIKANAALTQQKVDQHEQIIRNYQRKFSERTKAMVEQNKMLKENNQKMKRTFTETEQTLRFNLEKTNQENKQLKEELRRVETEKKNLLQAVSQMQDDLMSKEELIARLQKISDGREKSKTNQQKVQELLQARFHKRLQSTIQNQEISLNCSTIENLGLRDIFSFAKMLSFLTPKEIFTLSATSKKINFLCHSKVAIRSLCSSIIAIKNRSIGYYHKHIDYFQKMCHKIPEQVLQMAYFRYHILKESAGQQTMQALNASSLIFQGRFQGQELYNGLPDNNKQIPNLSFEEAHILEVDPSIVEEFKEEKKYQRDQLIKLFEQMYCKIRTTYELYRADQESSTLFISNTLKHISRVFVLAKSLYLQAQTLQQLNSFLLSELNKWDRMEIDKNLQLEDLRAQLQAERKLKLFFTDKSIKGEQKALLEQNLKLTYEMKYNKLNELMNLTCCQKQQLVKKSEAVSKYNQKLSAQCKQLRRAYEVIKQKYSHVIEQLVVVKETIIKMNII